MFSPIDLSDRKRLATVFFSQKGRNCDYSFVNAYAWKDHTRWEVGKVAGSLCLRYPHGDKGYVYLYPAGENAPRVLEEICRRERQAGRNEVIFYGGKEMKEGFGGEELIPQRGQFDYLYRAEDLLYYPPSLRTQRQQAAAFEKTYPRHRLVSWEDEDLFIAARDCLWEENDRQQRQVLSRLWECREGLEGAVLLVEEQVVGITAAGFLCEDTLDVHLEKADTSYRGVYAFLRRAFLQRVYEKQSFLFVNREEDMDIAGLREAKLRLKPVELVEKFTVHLTL